MDYATVRERAFKAIQERPKDVDSISHNLSVALMQLNVPATTLAATMKEFDRRWEYAIAQKR